MKLAILPAAIAMIVVCAASGQVQASAQPEVDSQKSAAATNGKAPDQAEKSKMEIKQERDAQKYQNTRNQAGNQPASSGSAAGNTAMKSTAPGYESTGTVTGVEGKSSGNAAAGQSGKKPAPP